jgi:hypothetical protein
MKKLALICLLTSCSNWQYQEIRYLKCKKLDEIHVHLYHHDNCEWDCLHLDKQYIIVIDTFKVKYRINTKGNVSKVKLIK